MSLPINILLPEHFLEKEVRCGYTVCEKQKKIWAVHLDLFKQFSDLCNRFDIKFQVAFGTLIGAARHKGFIPWDDDFDVWMDRTNYQKLMRVPQSEVPWPYFLQTPLSDRKYFVGLSRFRNSLTTAAIRGLCSVGYNNGIYIDIYVLDGLDEALLKRRWQYLLKSVCVKLIQLHYQRGARSRSLFDLFCYCLKPVSLLIGYERLVSAYDKILAMRTSTSEKLSFLVNGLWERKGYWITKSELNDTILMPYEHITVPAPRNYDEILRRIYGDYMRYPPEEERGAWHEGIIHFEPEIPYGEYISNVN